MAKRTNAIINDYVTKRHSGVTANLTNGHWVKQQNS